MSYVDCMKSARCSVVAKVWTIYLYDLLTCVGFIDVDEVIDAFRDLGVSLDRSEALRLIRR